MCKKSISVHEIHSLIAKEYYTVASEAMIFTQLLSIEASRREAGGKVSLLWRIKSDRKSPSTDHVLQSATLSLVHSSTTSHISDAHNLKTNWLVISAKTCQADLPSDFPDLIEKHRLRDPIMTRLAAQLDPEGSSTVHKLFATLPLPVEIKLPVHVSSSFILSDDRRVVRFNANGQDAESRFNTWLLSDLVPPLYVQLLDVLSAQFSIPKGRKSWWSYWPSKIALEARDSMSAAVAVSFYRKHVKETTRPICSTGNSIRKAPRDVVLVPHSSDPEGKVALLLAPSTVILPPSEIRSAIRNAHEPSDDEQTNHIIPLLSPAVLRKILLQEVTSFTTLFRQAQISIKTLQAVVKYILQDEISSAVGLPLIPLADGTLAICEQNSDGFVYKWRYCKATPILFPLNLFVDPEFEDISEEFSRTFGISSIDPQAVQRLVMTRFQEGKVKYHLTDEEKRWIQDFWTVFPTLVQGSNTPHLEKLDNLPLIPTTIDRMYVSSTRLRESGVYLHHSSSLEWLRSVAEIFGAVVVDLYRCSPILQAYLRPKSEDRSRPEFIKILELLQDVQLDQTFSRLVDRAPLYSKFIEWSQRCLDAASVPDNQFHLASRLPIWETLNPERPRKSAHEVGRSSEMLPEITSGRHTTVRTFIDAAEEGNILKYDSIACRRLQVVPMTLPQMRGRLRLPDRLTDANIMNYYRLLKLLATHREQDARTLLAPNSSGSLVPVNTLFSRSQPLFFLLLLYSKFLSVPVSRMSDITCRISYVRIELYWQST